MTDTAAGSTAPAGRKKSEMVFNYVFFVFVVVMWAAFAYGVLAAPGSLDSLWASVRSLHWVVQLGMWLLLLPWMIAMWIWESGWALWIRALLVVGLAWVTILITNPWASPS